MKSTILQVDFFLFLILDPGSISRGVEAIPIPARDIEWHRGLLIWRGQKCEGIAAGSHILRWGSSKNGWHIVRKVEKLARW